MKPGRKPKIGESERKQILVAVRLGGSIADAAGAVGIAGRTIRDHMQRNPEFRIGVYQARKVGKMRLIKKVATARAWQSAAWMLERTYGKQFGRKDVREVRQKRTVEHEHRHTIDYDQIAKDLERFAGARPTADGNGKPVHPDRADATAGPVPRMARA